MKPCARAGGSAEGNVPPRDRRPSRPGARMPSQGARGAPGARARAQRPRRAPSCADSQQTKNTPTVIKSLARALSRRTRQPLDPQTVEFGLDRSVCVESRKKTQHYKYLVVCDDGAKNSFLIRARHPWHFSMKRFFASVGGSSDPSKRARGDGGADGDAGAGAGALDAPTRQPKSFMTWNCNSFLGRMRKELDKKSFLRYVEDHDPDIIALQETWLPAAAPDRYDARRRVEISRYTGRVPPVSVACLRPTGRISRVHGVVGTPTCFTRRPARRPSPARRERLTRNTYSYDVTRASLRFPKSRGELRDDTKQYREDKSLIDLVMRQRPLSRYRAFWACADIKRAGCGVLVKKDVEPPKRVTRSLESSARRDAHDEGRVLLLEFSELVFLNVYAQNNGWTAESMAKRRAWDEQLRRFLVAADDDATVSRAKPSRRRRRRPGTAAAARPTRAASPCSPRSSRCSARRR